MKGWKRWSGILVVILVVLVAVESIAKDLVVYSSVDEENAKKILNGFSKATGIKGADGFSLHGAGAEPHRSGEGEPAGGRVVRCPQ